MAASSRILIETGKREIWLTPRRSNSGKQWSLPVPPPGKGNALSTSKVDDTASSIEPLLIWIIPGGFYKDP
jgi:hypothetical protein